MRILSAPLLLLLLQLLAACPVYSFVSKSPVQALRSTGKTTQLFESSSSDPWSWVNSGGPQPVTKEETLLRIHCSSNFDAQHLDSVLLRVQEYIMGFPFERALPIQPMDCQPSSDNSRTIELIFQRDHDKSQDGGLRFLLVPNDQQDSFELQVERISEGQSCLKSTTEKLVIRGFVQGFTGNNEHRSKWQSVLNPPTDALVSVQSLFHKWMFE